MIRWVKRILGLDAIERDVQEILGNQQKIMPTVEEVSANLDLVLGKEAELVTIITQVKTDMEDLMSKILSGVPVDISTKVAAVLNNLTKSVSDLTAVDAEHHVDAPAVSAADAPVDVPAEAPPVETPPAGDSAPAQ